MALTPEQIQQTREHFGVQPQNKNRQTVSGAEYVASLQMRDTVEKNPGYFQRVIQGFKEGAEDIVSGIEEGAGQIEQGGIGNFFRGATTGMLRTVGGVAKTALMPAMEAPGIKEATEFVGEQIAQVPGVLWIIEQAEKLKETNPTLAKDLENILDITALGLGSAGEKGIKATGEKVATKAGSVTQKIGSKIDDVVPAIQQKGSEILERVPRTIGKAKEEVATLTAKAQKLKESTPAIRDAIKSNLDNRIINAVTEADDFTKKAYQEIVKIADTAKEKLGLKKRPEIVAGNTVADQIKIIDKQRKTIGQKIGDFIDSLSDKKTINMVGGYKQIDDVLRNNGIIVTKDGKLIFSGKFTPAERSKIQELYNLAKESGDVLSPKQIKNADQLFSKLQRESKFENIGNIFVTTVDGEKSLFNVFRDIFNDKLVGVMTPEIKNLNTSYQKLKSILDDVEKSITKSGNFQMTKDMSLGEFAQTNLRRIMSDAQSAAAYRGILQKVDDLARSLGYKGAKPEDLITFATEIRKLFPDVIPETSFTGGIKTGIKDVAGKVLELGKPDLKDQQKALLRLLGLTK